MAKRITIVTGTPGTGKTTLAKALAKKEKAHYVDVNTIIKQHKLDSEYDKARKAAVIDTKELSKILQRIIKAAKEDLIIDSHLSHYLSAKIIDRCIVTKTQLKTLRERLKKRKYAKAKIQENLDCEIFDICKTEAQEFGHKVQIVYT